MYLMAPKIISQCQCQSLSGPATLINLSQARVTAELLSETVNRFKRTDDVFSEAFLSTLLIAGTTSNETDAKVSNLLSKWNASLAFVHTAQE